MDAKLKHMWTWLIDQIPSSNLDAYAWRFGLSAILLSIAGGLCGWIALDIRDRASRVRAGAEGERSARLKITEDELSKAKSELARIKESQAPWALSADKKESFIAQLKDAPKGKVAIEYIRSDEIRSREFAAKIRDILKDAGYEVWGYRAGFMQADAPPLVGIRLTIKDQKSDVVGGGLQRAFKVLGFEVEGTHRAAQDATYDDDFVVIYIGLKP